MVDDTRSNDRGSGAATQPGPSRRPGLIRSIAHRLAGERLALPIEGRLASFAGANWLRTLPYVRAWAKYPAAGLTVVGVYTPEFGFERNVDNVGDESE